MLGGKLRQGVPGPIAAWTMQVLTAPEAGADAESKVGATGRG